MVETKRLMQYIHNLTAPKNWKRKKDTNKNKKISNENQEDVAYRIIVLFYFL